MSLFPAERKCTMCQKTFLGYDQWVFRRGNRWFCSYGCTQEYERKKKAQRNTGRLRRTDRKMVIDLLNVGVKPQKIADKMGVSVNAILYYQNRLKA